MSVKPRDQVRCIYCNSKKNVRGALGKYDFFHCRCCKKPFQGFLPEEAFPGHSVKPDAQEK